MFITNCASKLCKAASLVAVECLNTKAAELFPQADTEYSLHQMSVVNFQHWYQSMFNESVSLTKVYEARAFFATHQKTIGRITSAMRRFKWKAERAYDFFLPDIGTETWFFNQRDSLRGLVHISELVATELRKPDDFWFQQWTPNQQVTVLT